MEKIYFLHIPKTAGTSFKTMLRTGRSDADICSFYTMSNLTGFNPEKMSLLEGHLGYDCSGLLMGYKSVTMLRDPLKRSISHFQHAQRDPNHYLFQKINDEKMSFEDFVFDDECNHTINNAMVRYLGLSIDFQSLIYNADNKVLDQIYPEVLHNQYQLEQSDEESYIKAAERLEREDVIYGITELFDKSVKKFEDKGILCEGVSLLNLNIANKSLALSQLSERCLSKLIELNRLDIKLYQYAVKNL